MNEWIKKKKEIEKKKKIVLIWKDWEDFMRKRIQNT